MRSEDDLYTNKKFPSAAGITCKGRVGEGGGEGERGRGG